MNVDKADKALEEIKSACRQDMHWIYRTVAAIIVIYVMIGVIILI